MGQYPADIEIREATFEDGEFRGCRFEDVKLPLTPSVHLVPGFPRVARPPMTCRETE